MAAPGNRRLRREKTRGYQYYAVYACDPGVWSKLAAKYLLDVTGNIRDQRTRQAIAALE